MSGTPLQEPPKLGGKHDPDTFPDAGPLTIFTEQPPFEEQRVTHCAVPIP